MDIFACLLVSDEARRRHWIPELWMTVRQHMVAGN